jgi:predicted DNA repair protein MutK
MFIYAPFLIVVPLLLLLGILFVVGASGFIIMLGGAYFVFAGLIGLPATAVRKRLHRNKAQVRLEPKERLSTARTSRQAQRA